MICFFLLKKMAQTGQKCSYIWKFGTFRACLFFGRSLKSLQKFGKSKASDSVKLYDTHWCCSPTMIFFYSQLVMMHLHLCWSYLEAAYSRLLGCFNFMFRDGWDFICIWVPFLDLRNYFFFVYIWNRLGDFRTESSDCLQVNKEQERTDKNHFELRRSLK